MLSLVQPCDWWLLCQPTSKTHGPLVQSFRSWGRRHGRMWVLPPRFPRILLQVAGAILSRPLWLPQLLHCYQATECVLIAPYCNPCHIITFYERKAPEIFVAQLASYNLCHIYTLGQFCFDCASTVILLLGCHATCHAVWGCHKSKVIIALFAIVKYVNSCCRC